MKPKTTKTHVASVVIASLTFAMSSLGAVLDFETINSTVPIEGMAISNQFQPYFGVSFRRLDGGYPVIAKKGAPRASIGVPLNPDLTLYDTLHPSDPRAGEFGDFSLTDDGVPGGTKQIILDFKKPVSKASGYIFDIDSGERMTIRAYSDDGITEVGIVVRAYGDPETGNGRSTPWSFDHATKNISQIRFRETGPSSDANVAFDNFESDYSAEPSEASLDLHLLPGVTITGTVGWPHRIDYADQLTPTNWVALTNVFLPSSPFLFIDTTSPASAQRFYRAVALP